jgi:hypothetical protein
MPILGQSVIFLGEVSFCLDHPLCMFVTGGVEVDVAEDTACHIDVFGWSVPFFVTVVGLD